MASEISSWMAFRLGQTGNRIRIGEYAQALLGPTLFGYVGT